MIANTVNPATTDRMTNIVESKYPHYIKDVGHLAKVDIYRMLRLYQVADPCLQHAIKKLVCAGNRGYKDQEKDVREAIDTLNRFLEMNAEDNL